MMKELKIKSIDELYLDIPKQFRLNRRLNLPNITPESEVKRHIESILSKNKTCQQVTTFLGAGCWPHYVPAAVDNIMQRTELQTSYTPYQPEISQGMLQLLFEYQSLICELTGMDVANSSMYDWASALGEAARMTARLTGRREILVPKIIHPDRYATLTTYIEPAGINSKSVSYDRSTGLLNLWSLEDLISDKTAAVYIENPSYLGSIETQGSEIAEIAHNNGALLIVGVDPVSLGILKSPGEYGADIVIGEGQPLGNHMNFGGPLLGIYAIKDELAMIRQLPGRVVGLTNTLDGKDIGFCMVLQTREQHIRRQKATSNICSNESLCAIASAAYLSLLGPKGLRILGENIILRTHYATSLLSEIKGIETPIFQSQYFKEFTVNFSGLEVQEVHDRLLELGIHGGKDVSTEFPELGNVALYCVTEVHSKDEIDRLAEVLNEIFVGGSD